MCVLKTFSLWCTRLLASFFGVSSGFKMDVWERCSMDNYSSFKVEITRK